MGWCSVIKGHEHNMDTWVFNREEAILMVRDFYHKNSNLGMFLCLAPH